MQAEQTPGPAQQNEQTKSSKKARPLSGQLRIIRRAVTGIAATSLALLMFLVAAEVVGRYLFNYPIPGGYELTEYLMAIIIPLSIAICADHKSHVGVDLVVEQLSWKTRARVDAVTLLITLGLCAVLAWQCCVAVPESYDSGLKSAVLQIPVYPSVISVAVGTIALTLFVFVHFLESLKKAF